MTDVRSTQAELWQLCSWVTAARQDVDDERTDRHIWAALTHLEMAAKAAGQRDD
jgi:hypothetical protein